MGLRERLSFESAEGNTLFACAAAHRYEFAADILAGKRVLELACGVGHGTMVLAERCLQVRAVDSDVGAVDAAQAAHEPAAHVTFAASDLAAAVRSSAADGVEAIVLVSDQVADADAVLAALAEAVGQGMPLVLAAPVGGGQQGRQHGSRLRATDLCRTVELSQDAVFFRQYVAEGSVIAGEDTDDRQLPATATAAGLDDIEPDSASHVLAGVNLGLAAASRPDAATLAWRMATVDASYVTRVEGANAALRHANSRLARERVGVGQAPAARALSHAVNERVAELEGQLLAADARRGEADGALDELRSRFQELETWAREIERQLLEVHATNVWRLGQRYWQVKQRLRLGRRD